MMDEQTYKWVFLPTMTYFKNRKEAKMCLGGSDRFNYLQHKGYVRYIEKTEDKVK